MSVPSPRLRRPLFRATAIGACVALTATGCTLGGGGGGGDEAIPEDISLIVPFSPGGGTDTWARFMAPYLEERIEGNPSVTVDNVPGGESIPGTNEFVREADGSGETMLSPSATTYFQDLLGRDAVEFDFTELQPLMLNGTGGVIYTSAESGLETAEDFANPEGPLSYGGISATGLDLVMLLLFELFELDVETTLGFEGRGPASLALQRGEVNIDYQTTSAYQTQVEPLVEEGTAIPLMSFGILDEQGNIVRDPNFPDLPTPGEVYEQINGEAPSGPAWEAYRAFFGAGFAYQKGVWAVPEIPDPLAQEFYDAAQELQTSEQFQEEAEAVLGGYPLYSGDAVAEAVEEVFALEDDVRSYVAELLATEYGTEIG